MPAAVESVKVSEGRVRATLQSLRVPHWGLWLIPGFRVGQPWPRCGRSAKWSLEDNTACYGQEKLSVNVATCLSLFLSPSVSHTPQKLQPPTKKLKSRIYSYKEVLSFITSTENTTTGH